MKLRVTFSLLAAILSFIVSAQQDALRYLQRPLPVEWMEEDTLFQQTLPVDDQWWKVFEDPILDYLIEAAVNQNYSLLIAMDRIDMAKANLNIQRGDYYPSLGLSPGWTRQQTSAHTTTGVPQSYPQYFSLGMNMSWEIDVFGSIRNRVKAQEETFEASKEEYFAAMVSLCAQVATAYINLRELQEELEVANNNIISQEKILNITEVRFNTGLVSKLDVAQAKSVYYSTKATIPTIEAGIIQYMNSLAILLGVYPEEIRSLLEPYKPLPDYMEPVGVGIPANLLRRRPDIREAEREINAQLALLDAAKADFLPTFAINGSFGYAARKPKNLFQSNSLIYEISPAININLFQGKKLINARLLAQSELNEAIHTYNQTVLTAVQEVDNAMSSYQNSIKQIVALREVLYQGQETLRLSLELYKQGLSAFQDVLDAQRSLLSYETSLVQAQGNSLIYLINMYQALGGGWH